MRFETSVVINRPIDEVWALTADWDSVRFNLPRLRGVTLGVRVTSPGPMRLGSTFQSRIVILGFETTYTAVITEFDPPHAVAFSGKGLGLRSFSLRETHEATADGTKIVRVNEFEPRPVFKPLWWIIGPWLRRRADAFSQNIRRLAEVGRG